MTKVGPLIVLFFLMFNVNSMLDYIASKYVGNIIWKLFTLPAHFLRLIKSEDASLAGEGAGPTFAC